ncbi:MAG: hypothetical protein HY518_05380 [Candidatus Aenigmarchaeota archaeon]|nr:hypothetical protein [Candidatus Aenigmarchaeota archaeon]
MKKRKLRKGYIQKALKIDKQKPIKAGNVENLRKRHEKNSRLTDFAGILSEEKAKKLEKSILNSRAASRARTKRILVRFNDD